MTVELLSPIRSARLQRQALTYEGVGGPLTTPAPGYRQVARSRRLRAGQSFVEAVDLLMTWQVHVAAGLRVAASSAHIEPEVVSLMRFGVGVLALSIPCRVVAVVDEPFRRGFTYGTLPGHPESGEEAFVLQQQADGSIDFVISAFSRPASRLARVGGPATARVQQWMTDRYLAAFD